MCLSFDLTRFQGEDSLGMAMIFTMASRAKEELNLMMDDIKRIRAEAEEERIRKIEEAENAKFHGTKLTVERFMEWKAKFEKELAEKESEEKKARLKELKGKLTGEQEHRTYLNNGEFNTVTCYRTTIV